MLTLQKKQIDAFRDVVKEAFIERMYSHIISVFPEKCGNVTKPQLTEIIKRNIATVTTYELEMESSIRRCLMHATEHGWFFNNQPPATVQRILMSTQVSESVKMTLLDKLLFNDER
ncbi:MAG: hypothetical protein KAR13_14595 [Desulfobulbaceae bacterium]|nr:hypothetical protein [Desulfobulbaceae bacterium]